jgi:glycosyltransferase involved in cell wall biosynthesis
MSQASQLASVRAVPEHDTAVFGPRRHAHALVIPVINEGERIRDQLRRIAEAAPRVDVVVADGGSTDGSLDADFLKATGVRALLTKRGPGRLSAQLRMAYAWCLDQGYNGVVTVDGNGKDGVDAIDAFVAALEQGYDLVQGSRYVKGGAAVNTPMDRHIAGRLIHAPLISLAAGFWYTDTTNGFRAYSRRFLEHPKVQPFRDVFANYNLLFYLSIRAPQLKLKCREIPVRRVYPDKGKTPTKVSGLAGRAAMLRELLDAVAGKFNPRG